MTVAETILVFAGAPLAVVLLLALVTIGPAARKRRPRYKPGQPWNHEPIWYEPHPEATGHGGGHGDETTAIGSSVYGERHGADAEATHAVSGGSSSAGSSLAGSSRAGASAVGASSGGASAVGATAARVPNPAGPLGGARGTW